MDEIYSNVWADQVSLNPSPSVDPPKPPPKPVFPGSHPLFFYGTLTLPHVLSNLLNLSSPPTYRPARIRGYTIKKWGPYPALVKSTNSADFVLGMTWIVEHQAHLDRLTRYEGTNYALVPIEVEVMEDGATKLEQGWTYIWNGYAEELDEGIWEPKLFPASPFIS